MQNWKSRCKGWRLVRINSRLWLIREAKTMKIWQRRKEDWLGWKWLTNLCRQDLSRWQCETKRKECLRQKVTKIWHHRRKVMIEFPEKTNLLLQRLKSKASKSQGSKILKSRRMTPSSLRSTINRHSPPTKKDTKSLSQCLQQRKIHFIKSMSRRRNRRIEQLHNLLQSLQKIPKNLHLLKKNPKLTLKYSKHSAKKNCESGLKKLKKMFWGRLSRSSWLARQYQSKIFNRWEINTACPYSFRKFNWIQMRLLPSKWNKLKWASTCKRELSRRCNLEMHTRVTTQRENSQSMSPILKLKFLWSKNCKSNRLMKIWMWIRSKWRWVANLQKP